jgi:hypothetical protein
MIDWNLLGQLFERLTEDTDSDGNRRYSIIFDLQTKRK